MIILPVLVELLEGHGGVALKVRHNLHACGGGHFKQCFFCSSVILSFCRSRLYGILQSSVDGRTGERSPEWITYQRHGDKEFTQVSKYAQQHEFHRHKSRIIRWQRGPHEGNKSGQIEQVVIPLLTHAFQHEWQTPVNSK